MICAGTLKRKIYVVTIFSLSMLLSAKPKNSKVKEEITASTVALVKPQKPAEDPELVELREKLQKISAQNDLLQQEHRFKMHNMEKKIQELSVNNRLTQELNTKEALEFAKDLKETEKKKQELQAKNDLDSERIKKLSLQLSEKDLLKNEENQKEQRKIGLVLANLNLEQQKASKDLQNLQRELQIIESKTKLKRQVSVEPKCLHKPLSNKRLIVSDRRIALNGPIIQGVGSYIADRIDFYNNKSVDPIFIIIDSSPGGSVMEGYRILKAMESSKAPIHVVVKSYAASMAAVITTLADESYAYPNAVLLHHEMSTYTSGNMTQLKERLDIAKKWENRLMKPLAKKLKYRSIDSFRKDMYKYNSDGNWSNFADDAKKFKWIKHIVEEIRETGVVKHPDDMPAVDEKSVYYGKKRDQVTGKFFQELPSLRPYDCYHLYNPYNFYRAI